MAGVYGSSLPPGSTCFRASLTKGAEAFVVKPKKVKTCNSSEYMVRE